MSGVSGAGDVGRTDLSTAESDALWGHLRSHPAYFGHGETMTRLTLQNAAFLRRREKQKLVALRPRGHLAAWLRIFPISNQSNQTGPLIPCHLLWHFAAPQDRYNAELATLQEKPLPFLTVIQSKDAVRSLSSDDSLMRCPGTFLIVISEGSNDGHSLSVSRFKSMDPAKKSAGLRQPCVVKHTTTQKWNKRAQFIVL